MNKNTKSFEGRFNKIIPQAIEHFEANVRRISKEEPTHYDESPQPWLQLKTFEEKFEYIMNHDYWVRIWTNFLINMLIDEIYKEQEFKFILN